MTLSNSYSHILTTDIDKFAVVSIASGALGHSATSA